MIPIYSHVETLTFIADLPVRFYDTADVIISGGIEISGFKAAAISRRLITAEAVHEEYRFVAYRDHAMMSLKETVQLSMQVVLECQELTNMKVIEYVEEEDQILLEDLVTPVIQEVSNSLPLVRSNLTLVATANRFDSFSLPPNLSIVQLDNLTKDDTFLMAVGVGILTKDTGFAKRLLSNVVAGGFLLSREDLSGTYAHSLLQRSDLNIILEKRTEREALVLLRKAHNTVRIQEIVHISNSEFSWIDKLKDAMDMGDKLNSNARIIVVSEGDPECGVLGLVKCLRQEQGGEKIGCVFIQDKGAPKFSLLEPFYMRQLQLDLPFNVLRPGFEVWGSYKHFSLPLPEPRPVRCGYVVQEVR